MDSSIYIGESIILVQHPQKFEFQVVPKCMKLW